MDIVYIAGTQDKFTELNGTLYSMFDRYFSCWKIGLLYSLWIKWKYWQFYSIQHYLLTIYSVWDCTRHYWECLTHQDRFVLFVLKEFAIFRKIIWAEAFLSVSYTDSQPLYIKKNTYWLLSTIPPFILKLFYLSPPHQPQILSILHITSFISFSEGSPSILW